MIYNLWRKLTEDKEDILASREKSLASLGNSSSPTYTINNLKLLRMGGTLYSFKVKHVYLNGQYTPCLEGYYLTHKVHVGVEMK